MSPAVQSSLEVVAYLALFAGVALAFLFANLVIGRLVRPSDPHAEKLEIYECGEPTIGSSFVQFDLRFYVVALLFIIFDVEVAFFFPWAIVFGKATHLSDSRNAIVAYQGTDLVLTESAIAQYKELGVRHPTVTTVVPKSLQQGQIAAGDQKKMAEEIAHQGGRQLAMLTIVDILVFFSVLLVGFAYVWKRGDLDWVRAVSRERARRGSRGGGDVVAQEAALSV